MKIPKNKAHCRWCEKNVSVQKMAVYSYKLMAAGFTGVCLKCMTGPGAEQREAKYLSRQ